MFRRINAEGLALIKQWEGLRLEAYRCPAGVWTIGYGSTGAHVKPFMKITEAQAEALLKMDLDRFERAIDRLITVPLNDNQFATLVSWAFNVGIDAVEKSTLRRLLNAGGYDAVPGQLARWNKVKGKTMRGLTNRRAAEAGLWAKGEFVDSSYVATEAPPKPIADAVGTGLIGTGVLTEAINQLTPLATHVPQLNYIVAGLILTGVLSSLLGSLKRIRESF
jgi:lysozyme